MMLAQDGASRGIKEGREGEGETEGPRTCTSQLLCPSPQRTAEAVKGAGAGPASQVLLWEAATSPKCLVVQTCSFFCWESESTDASPSWLSRSSSGFLPWPGGVQDGRRRGVITKGCPALPCIPNLNPGAPVEQRGSARKAIPPRAWHRMTCFDHEIYKPGS